MHVVDPIEKGERSVIKMVKLSWIELVALVS